MQGLSEIRAGDITERYQAGPATTAGLRSREAYDLVRAFLMRAPWKIIQP
jgi:hypothetical protein